MTESDQQLPLLAIARCRRSVPPHGVAAVCRQGAFDRALEHAMLDNKQVLLVAQRNASDDQPGADDLYQVGTVSKYLQLLKLPDGTIKVLVEG